MGMSTKAIKKTLRTSQFGTACIIRPRPARHSLGQLGDAQIDAAKLAQLCRRFDVRELSLFGPAARGEMSSDSDIDVVVEFLPGARIGLLRFESLVEELEVLAGRKVDLVTRGGRPQVLRDSRVIYAA
jgi:predicted nucleotidyltransferase